MRTFSQRKGLKPDTELVQIAGMNDELRNGLWNVLDVFIWSTEEFVITRHGWTGKIRDFSRDLWFHYFKLPIDKRPENGHEILQQIRTRFFQYAWNEVYDFLEYVVRHQRDERPRLPEFLNKILEREVAGYRFVSGVVTDITTDQEVAMLEEALSDTKFGAVSEHLQRALDSLNKWLLKRLSQVRCSTRRCRLGRTTH
jgi:hypothetical protein